MPTIFKTFFKADHNSSGPKKVGSFGANSLSTNLAVIHRQGLHGKIVCTWSSLVVGGDEGCIGPS